MNKNSIVSSKKYISVNKEITFLLTFFLLLCSAMLHAQEDRESRRITLEGENFSIGELLEEVEVQTDIRIINRSEVIDRSEIVGQVTSLEMVRDVVDQVLAGTRFIFQSSVLYAVISVERQDEEGSRVVNHIFVNAATGQVVRIDDVFGQSTSMLDRDIQVGDMLAGQILSGGQYSYHSSGRFTVITVVVDDGERQIVVDMATGEVVEVEEILQRLERISEQRTFMPYVFPGPEYLPRFSLKTNLLYGATTTMNLGAEFLLNRYLTLDVAVGWNPFVYRDNRKFAHLMAQPTLRFWIQEPFNGHFLGLSAMYTYFNISGIRYPYDWLGVFPRMKNSRFYGHGYGASLQYGHQWILSPRWSIEAFVNVGYMFFDYRRYECGWCGQHLGNETRHYLGPTNAGISLIYVFR